MGAHRWKEVKDQIKDGRSIGVRSVGVEGSTGMRGGRVGVEKREYSVSGRLRKARVRGVEVEEREYSEWKNEDCKCGERQE